MKIVGVIFGLSVLAVAAFAIVVIEIENAQFRNNSEMANYQAASTPDSKVLVIYFSRSGNTELMAMEIAKHYEANLVHLEADDYRIGFRGWLNALKDSQTKHAVITPETIDMAQYDTIFIGSPIWWYSPAPPVWQFVANNDFSGKKVILFNTFNSRFKQEYIDEFIAGIEVNNGNFVKHIYVKRERMTSQISSEELLQAVHKQLKFLQVQK